MQSSDGRMRRGMAVQPHSEPQGGWMFNENAVQWLTLQSQHLVFYVAQFNYCLLTIPIQEVAEGQRERL